MVLNRVVCSAGHELGNLSPLVSDALVRLDDQTVFLVGPLLAVDSRIQVVMPPARFTLKYVYPYLSRHCLPMRPGSDAAMAVQLRAPCLCTISMTIWSSRSLHGPFTRLGLSTFCQRWRHCTSVRLSKNEEIRFQFLA